MNAVVLIPAYKPEETLLTLVDALRAAGAADIVVVDDGSGSGFDGVFNALDASGTTVIRHIFNRGKGSALRTGIKHILNRYPGMGIVTCDADGQHTPADILSVGAALERHPDALVLGERRFSGDVPARSIAGNTFMRLLFRLITGKRVRDTQTGLRGLPCASLESMRAIAGDRYEYETNMLLKAPAMGLGFFSVDIETVYINDNAGSHYDSVRDSARIGLCALVHLMPDIARCAAEWGTLFALMFIFPGSAGLYAAPLSKLPGMALSAGAKRRWQLLVFPMLLSALLPLEPPLAKLVADVFCFVVVTLVGVR